MNRRTESVFHGGTAMTKDQEVEQNGEGTADGRVTGQCLPTTLPAIVWSYVAYYDRKFPRGPLEPIVVGRCSDGLHERGREEPQARPDPRVLRRPQHPLLQEPGQLLLHHPRHQVQGVQPHSGGVQQGRLPQGRDQETGALPPQRAREGHRVHPRQPLPHTADLHGPEDGARPGRARALQAP